MAIAVGDRIPDVKVFTFGDKGPESVTSAEVLGHGTVVLFGVPGAFTPTCSDHHLPGFVLRADDLRAKGEASGQKRPTIECMRHRKPPGPDTQ